MIIIVLSHPDPQTQENIIDGALKIFHNNSESFQGRIFCSPFNAKKLKEKNSKIHNFIDDDFPIIYSSLYTQMLNFSQKTKNYSYKTIYVCGSTDKILRTKTLSHLMFKQYPNIVISFSPSIFEPESNLALIKDLEKFFNGDIR